MKSFTFIVLASLALFATAAVAQNNNYRGNMGNSANHGRLHQANYSNCGCGMNNRMGSGMGQGMQGRGVQQGNTAAISSGGNWRANPSYQGQADRPVTGN